MRKHSPLVIMAAASACAPDGATGEDVLAALVADDAPFPYVQRAFAVLWGPGESTVIPSGPVSQRENGRVVNRFNLKQGGVGTVIKADDVMAQYVRRVDLPVMNRGDAAPRRGYSAETRRLPRGSSCDESRRRRGRDVDIPRRRVARLRYRFFARLSRTPRNEWPETKEAMASLLEATKSDGPGDDAIKDASVTRAKAASALAPCLVPLRGECKPFVLRRALYGLAERSALAAGTISVSGGQNQLIRTDANVAGVGTFETVLFRADIPLMHRGAAAAV